MDSDGSAAGEYIMGAAGGEFTRRMRMVRGPITLSPATEHRLPMLLNDSPAPIPAPLFELDRATVIRGGTRVLRDLTLRIPLGQHTVILGPNGCGKSTFIKLISRELYPLAREGGTPPATVFGLRRWNVSELRNRLGLVTGDLTRDLQEMPALRVGDAVLSGWFSSFVVPPHRQIEPHMRAQAREALERVGATALSDRLVAELSTGEMRRVLIARALVHKPQALLLDEPTSGLDLVAQKHFIHMLGELAKQDITLVLVTHHLEEIVPEFRRVVLLHGGGILADGAPETVLTSENLSKAYGGELRVERNGDRFRAVLE
jgi:iron complex transport system ATP-binding protein